ncbi:hypothetical protein WJX77_007405 [Trebouxia sp. C0004]
MSKRARNPDVPEISAATRLAFKAEAAERLQAKAGHKEKRLGWGARLEAAAQAGAGIELESLAATEQKLPKEKKSKHRKKHKSHKKKKHHSSSDSDESSRDVKRRRVKGHRSKSKKRKLEDTSTSDSEASANLDDSKSEHSQGRHCSNLESR